MPRSDKHNFARRQHAAEIRQADARRELDTHLLTGDVPSTTDWDAALRDLTQVEDGQRVPHRSAPTGPAPSTLHKPGHGGYPS